MKRTPASQTPLQKELEKLSMLETSALALEAANPQPFPQPGSVCLCGTTGGPADQCSKAHRTPRAGILIACSCWCHVTSHWRIDMWREHCAQTGKS